MRISTISLTLALLVFASLNAYTKRAAPNPVKPLVHDGVEYSAPMGVEKMGVIEARDAKSKALLWAQKIYRIKYNPDLERDVQWVFIKEIEIEDESLIVINERGQKYALDLKTRKVTEAELSAD